MTGQDCMPDPSTATDNRRTAERRGCVIEIAVADHDRAFVPATVLDFSTGGVKLLVNPPPAPGEHLHLTFLSEGGRLFQIGATVVHYVEHGDTWALGCRFDRVLDENELAKLF